MYNLQKLAAKLPLNISIFTDHNMCIILSIVDVQEKTNDANEKYLRSLAHDSDKQVRIVRNSHPKYWEKVIP